MVVIKWCTECKRGELGWGLWDNLISEEGPIKLFLMPWMISSCYNLGITLKCGVWDKIFYDRQAPSADKNQYICFAHTRSRLTSDTSEACTRVIWVRVFYIPAPCHAFGDITYHSCLWYDVWWKFAIMIMKFKSMQQEHGACASVIYLLVRSWEFSPLICDMSGREMYGKNDHLPWSTVLWCDSTTQPHVITTCVLERDTINSD